MSKVEQPQQGREEVQTGLEHEEGRGGAGASRVDAGGGVFTDLAGEGKWMLEDDPDEYVEGVEGRPQPQSSGAAATAAPTAAPPAEVPPGTVPDGGFQVTTRTGLVFRGKDADEVLQRALDAVDRQALNVVQHRSEIANLRRQLGGASGAGAGVDAQGYARQRASRAPAASPVAASAPAVTGFDDTQFYNEFAKNPRAAMEMWAKDYFGMDDPRSALNRSYDVSVQVSDRIEIADFLASNPDFPQTTESSQMVLTRLDEDRAALTSWNMKVAFDKLVAEGLMQKIGGQGQAQGGGELERAQPGQRIERVPITFPARGAGAPPAPGNFGSPASSGADRAPTLEDFESWDFRKQQQWMKEKGMYHG